MIPSTLKLSDLTSALLPLLFRIGSRGLFGAEQCTPNLDRVGADLTYEPQSNQASHRVKPRTVLTAAFLILFVGAGVGSFFAVTYDANQIEQSRVAAKLAAEQAVIKFKCGLGWPYKGVHYIECLGRKS